MSCTSQSELIKVDGKVLGMDDRLPKGEDGGESGDLMFIVLGAENRGDRGATLRFISSLRSIPKLWRTRGENFDAVADSCGGHRFMFGFSHILE